MHGELSVGKARHIRLVAAAQFMPPPRVVVLRKYAWIEYFGVLSPLYRILTLVRLEQQHRLESASRVAGLHVAERLLPPRGKVSDRGPDH